MTTEFFKTKIEEAEKGIFGYQEGERNAYIKSQQAVKEALLKILDVISGETIQVQNIKIKISKIAKSDLGIDLEVKP